MVENIVAIELAYINTKHPDFHKDAALVPSLMKNENLQDQWNHHNNQRDGHNQQQQNRRQNQQQQQQNNQRNHSPHINNHNNFSDERSESAQVTNTLSLFIEILAQLIYFRYLFRIMFPKITTNRARLAGCPTYYRQHRSSNNNVPTVWKALTATRRFIAT